MARRRRTARAEATEESAEAAEAPAEEKATEEAPAEEPTEAEATEEVKEEATATRQREPRGEAVVDEPVEVQAGELVRQMFLALSEVGKPVLVTEGKGDTFLVSTTEAAPVKTSASKKGYKEKDFWSDEYKEFKDWWTPMGPEEKEKWATDNKVTWDAHEDALVNNIRLTVAVQEHKGISKYKPGFEDRNARIAGVPAE